MRPMILLLALAACATPHTPPTITASSEQNLVLFRQGRHVLQESFTYAETYCRARGQPSRYVKTDRVDEHSVLDYFECGRV